MARDPLEIADNLRAAGDQVEFVRGEAHQGQIALEAAALVQHPRINRLPRRRIDVVAAEALQNVGGIRSFENEFPEAGKVKNRDVLARRAMFGRMAREPLLPAERIFHHRSYAVSRKPVRSFPAILGAEAGALRDQAIVQRSLAQATAGFVFAIGPRHLVMQAKDFGHAFAQKGEVVGPRREAADVHRPEVDCGLAGDDPFGEIFSRAARAGDADGVESGGH